MAPLTPSVDGDVPISLGCPKSLRLPGSDFQNATIQPSLTGMRLRMLLGGTAAAVFARERGMLLTHARKASVGD